MTREAVFRWATRPTVLALAVILAALTLDLFWPIRALPRPAIGNVAMWFGMVLALGGYAIEVASALALARSKTTTKPFGEPVALVTSGPFRHSRNPLYCGMLLLVLGVFVAMANEWGLVLTPLLWLALDQLVIPGEEAILAARFPAAFSDYARQVPRWI